VQKIRDIRRIRNKIASDLHDDLGAALSSISIMSELVNQHVKDQSLQASSLLEKIGGSSRDMIESVNDMVWAINPQNDSFENIIKRMRSFASEILTAKDINFNMDFDKNLLQSKLKIEMRRNFYLIFKEAVNNVCKIRRQQMRLCWLQTRTTNLRWGFAMMDADSIPQLQTRAMAWPTCKKEQRQWRPISTLSLSLGGTTIELEFKNE
jgi:glucose-6-phosphate-specific signal transduction histidine kinase